MRVSENQLKIILDLYNRISPCPVEYLDEIPTDSLRFLFLFSYDEMSAPFIREMLMDGKTIGQISKKYCVKRGRVRTVGNNIGVLSV